MNVFLSWSGKRSKEAAELFVHYIKRITPHVSTFISTTDIASGTSWINMIEEKLNDSIAIVCLTKRALESQWLFYECGAMTRGKDFMVVPYLVEEDINLVGSPLYQLQHCKLDEESLLKVCKDINNRSTGHKLEEAVLQEFFERVKDDLINDLKEIGEKKFDDEVPAKLGSKKPNPEVQQLTSVTNRLAHDINNQMKEVMMMLSHIEDIQATEIQYSDLRRELIEVLNKGISYAKFDDSLQLDISEFDAHKAESYIKLDLDKKTFMFHSRILALADLVLSEFPSTVSRVREAIDEYYRSSTKKVKLGAIERAMASITSIFHSEAFLDVVRIETNRAYFQNKQFYASLVLQYLNFLNGEIQKQK